MRARSDSRPLFANGSTLHLKLVLCLLASLILVSLERRGALASLRQPLAYLIDPIRYAASAPARLAREFGEQRRAHAELAEENRRLRREALILQGRQLRLEALEQENIRLRGLLDTTFKVGDQVLIAEPLAINVVPYENLIVVNKGSRHGLQPGQAVVDGNGVVGQVLRVTAHNAEVIMITDASHALPVQVNRNGLRTIAVGTGASDRLELPYLAGSADIQAGDLLVTSGMGGGFPAGYPVARMVPEPGSGALRAVPVAQLDRNRELLVVRSDATPIPRIPAVSQAGTATDPDHAAR